MRTLQIQNAQQGLGLRFLAHNPARLAAAVAGVAMAVVIMFVELGLLLGVLNSQAMVASRINADLIVMDRARIDLHKWTDVRDIRLHQIAAQPGVAGRGVDADRRAGASPLAPAGRRLPAAAR